MIKPQHLPYLRHLLRDDGIRFLQYFFKCQQGTNFLLNWHHVVLQHVLDLTLTGEITRLIINIPPGCTKTEMAVIGYIARGLAINPSAKFIHTSYSDKLALTNSSKVKNIVLSQEYQELWDVPLAGDTTAKGRWQTKAGGEVLACSSFSAITGFRAGRMVDGFSGAIIIDDPLKPADALSDIKRSAVNKNYNNTIISRVAVPSVPIIVIMQRLHDDDLTGYLLDNGSGETWHHLCMPARGESEIPNASHSQPINVLDILKQYPSLPKATPKVLWEAKYSSPVLDTIMQGDNTTYSGQYLQNPSHTETALFKSEHWRFYRTLDDIVPDTIMIFGDTAQKTGERNDFSVFQCWVLSTAGHIYLLDQVRGKWEAPQLEQELIRFWGKHSGDVNGWGFGASKVMLEDASSGSSLIQSIQQQGIIPIKGIRRTKDKYTRAYATIKYLASHLVHLPQISTFVEGFLYETSRFTSNNTHKHDDQIDPFLDAVDQLLASNKSSKYTSVDWGKHLT